MSLRTRLPAAGPVVLAVLIAGRVSAGAETAPAHTPQDTAPIVVAPGGASVPSSLPPTASIDDDEDDDFVRVTPEPRDLSDDDDFEFDAPGDD